MFAREDVESDQVARELIAEGGNGATFDLEQTRNLCEAGAGLLGG